MISVAIIAKNAEDKLGLCLESVQNFAKDIVVVVDKSTADNTADIAAKYHTRVFYRDFDNFASQKNYAVSKTRFDWVFSLDADELSTPQLNSEMTAKLTGTQYAAFLIPRLNIIFGKPIYHSNWGPRDDTHIWLFNKKYCSWVGAVHEEVETKGSIGLLSNYKIHHSYENVEEFIYRMNYYTTREAKAARLYSHPLWDFFRRYIIHLGFLDGWHGLFLSYLMIIYHLTVWAKKTTSSSS